MKKLSEAIPILRTRSIVRHQINNLFYNQEDPDLAHYIDRRLKPKIRYYEIKARNNQLGFKSSKGLIIILSLVVSLSNVAVFGQDSIPVQIASVQSS